MVSVNAPAILYSLLIRKTRRRGGAMSDEEDEEGKLRDGADGLSPTVGLRSVSGRVSGFKESQGSRLNIADLMKTLTPLKTPLTVTHSASKIFDNLEAPKGFLSFKLPDQLKNKTQFERLGIEESSDGQAWMERVSAGVRKKSALSDAIKNIGRQQDAIDKISITRPAPMPRIDQHLLKNPIDETRLRTHSQ